MIGMVLGDRYELLEEIGHGGMAIVYKARCRLLNRYVAVKVLRPEYVNDEEFLARFETESQAAASLSHHNIVGIYDVGLENDIHYIVMEYVEGITLKEYITQNKILSWTETIDISVQILEALEHAHKNGIVHRDIKPHNIMITEDKTIKVMDFGIARASSETTLTLSGTTIGSVHYFSPEQAKGAATDNRTDIYSLGIVMYEMLTGRVPFDGDSPITIAIMQIQNAPPSPKEYNLSVPLAMEDVIMKSISKDKENRYQTAAAMISDLIKIQENPNYEIIHTNHGGEDEATKKVPAIKAEDLQPAEDEYIPEKPHIHRNPGETDIRIRQRKEEKQKKQTIVMGVLAAAAIMVVVVTGLWLTLFQGQTARETPNLVNMRLDVAQARYEGEFEIVETRRIPDDKIEEDCIISQSPIANASTKRTRIEVVVSSGPGKNILDDYKGMSETQVTSELADMGIKAEIVPQSSIDIPEGRVISTSPSAGSSVLSGSTVVVYISTGSDLVPVPYIVGMTIEEARAELEKNELKLGTIDYQESDKESGVVLLQSISAGNEVSKLDTVDVIVSKAAQSGTSGDNSGEQGGTPGVSDHPVTVIE